MPRYKALIEYDGTIYAGWQVQPNGKAIQNKIERAIEKFCGVKTPTQAAGRTDAGVHALGQVIHFDTTEKHDPFKVMQGINFHLKPNLIALVKVEEVDETFEARFSAKARHYEYQIFSRRARPVLDQNRVWHVPIELDHKAMAEAAKHFLGTHDFSTFRSKFCQARSPIRSIDRCDVTRDGDTIFINVSSRAFLHNQVRSIVGSLKYVGEGRWKPDMIKTILEAKDRKACGPVAPACGLYLTHVDY